MSTQLVLGVAGAAIGFAVGGPLGASIGFAAGGLVGNLIDPTVARGPSLNDRKLQTSEYGAPLPYVWGTFRLSGVNDWQRNDGEMSEHSSSGGGKGGGGGTESKSYTHSWSLKYCRSTVRGATTLVAIDKHWCDGRVVPEGDINPTVYIGWDGQLPDETIEADLGVGEVPANRFMGSEVYNEVQMDQFFNRLPNMEALVRTVGEVNGPITQLARHDRAIMFPKFPVIENGQWSINWEADQTLPEPSIVGTAKYWLLIDGPSVHKLTYGALAVVRVRPTALATLPIYQDHSDVFYAPIGGSGPGNFVAPGLGAYDSFTDQWTDVCANAGVEVGRYVHSYATSQDGRIFVVITVEALIAPTDWQWHRIVDGDLQAEGPVGDALHGGKIGFGAGNWGDSIHSNNKSVVESNGIYIWTFSANAPVFDSNDPEEQYDAIWLAYIDESDWTLKQYEAATPADSYGGPAAGQAYGASVYCPQDGYFATCLGNSTEYALYTRLGGFAQVTLADVVGDVLQLTGSAWDLSSLASGDFDVSQGATTIIKGVAMVSQMQRRNFIEMLRSAYAFDLIESDDGEQGILKLVMHGADPVAEIPDSDLGFAAEGEEPKALLYLVKHTQDAELPGRVTVKHYDPDQDYQLGAQSAQYRNISVDNETALDLPIVLTADEARQIAKRVLAKAWLERDTYGFTTSWAWAHLEPGDVATVHGHDLRITKKTEYPYGIIAWEGVPSAPYVADQPEDGAPSEGSTPPAPPAARGTTEITFFDVPILIDDHLDVGFYVAARRANVGSTWTGCSLQKSVDGGVNWTEIASVTTEATTGTVAFPIGGFSGGNVFDNTTVVRIVNVNASLTSVSEIAVLGGANWAILGREIFGFTTATQIDGTTWDLSGLLRGLRGTEWAIGTHGVNETFALASTLVNIATPIAEVGLERLYRAVTFGMPTTSATEQSFINTAQSARCYAPVHVSGGVTASSAMMFEAVARTRRNGAWRDSADIGQADAPAEFVLEIWNATYTQSARVVSGLTTSSYSYSSADQTTDFGAAQSTYYITWAQVGQFGLGVRARGAIPGPGATVDAPVNPGDGYNPPADPPIGGGAVDIELSYPVDNDRSNGFRIGDTLVAHFETTSAPTAGYIGVAEYSGTPYARHLILATDVDGNNVVAEAYGNPLASLELGTQYAFSVPLLATTDYYVIIRNELGNGDPSGTPGTLADISITLSVEI